MLSLLTPRMRRRLPSTADRELAVLQLDDIAYHGQIILAVIAETLEIARHAVGLVHVHHAEAAHDVELHRPGGPVQAGGGAGPRALQVTVGDPEGALATAPVKERET